MKRKRNTVLSVLALLVVVAVCLVLSFSRARRLVRDPAIAETLNFATDSYDSVRIGFGPESICPGWNFVYNRSNTTSQIKVPFWGNALTIWGEERIDLTKLPVYRRIRAEN